tara:strand:- start:4180 stop:5016 length:837 start_codon:yes stop_codon:yes gene_type:complete
MTTDFLKGYTIKPATVNTSGVVQFTDGTNIVTPNQKQCEAYGYTYNPITGSCEAFKFSSTLQQNMGNVKNNIQGAGNQIGTGTHNTYIMGEDNTVQGLSSNNIITGTNNYINSGISNACVYGRLGESTADNSIVLGGNAPADILGERQSIHLLYGVQTVDGSTTNSYLNNIEDSFFTIPDNTIFYFHADTVAVRVAGSGEGSVGDFAAWVERGVAVQIGETVTISRERDLIKSSGSVSNWRPAANNTGTNFRITVRGDADQTVEWCSNIRITQIKTGL